LQDFIIFFSPLDEFDAPKDKKNPKGIQEAFQIWKNVRQSKPDRTPPSDRN
jgi:hypothetical protein